MSKYKETAELTKRQYPAETGTVRSKHWTAESTMFHPEGPVVLTTVMRTRARRAQVKLQLFFEYQRRHLPVVPRSHGYVLVPEVVLLLELVDRVASQSVSVRVELDRVTGGACKWTMDTLLMERDNLT